MDNNLATYLDIYLQEEGITKPHGDLDNYLLERSPQTHGEYISAPDNNMDISFAVDQFREVDKETHGSQLVDKSFQALGYNNQDTETNMIFDYLQEGKLNKTHGEYYAMAPWEDNNLAISFKVDPISETQGSKQVNASLQPIIENYSNHYAEVDINSNFLQEEDKLETNSYFTSAPSLKADPVIEVEALLADDKNIHNMPHSFYEKENLQTKAQKMKTNPWLQEGKLKTQGDFISAPWVDGNMAISSTMNDGSVNKKLIKEDEILIIKLAQDDSIEKVETVPKRKHIRTGKPRGRKSKKREMEEHIASLKVAARLKHSEEVEEIVRKLRNRNSVDKAKAMEEIVFKTEEILNLRL